MTNNQHVLWSLFVRLSHWSVATIVLINAFNDTGYWHRVLGYIGATLVLLRIVYGFWFSEIATSKFTIPTLRSIKLHIQQICSLTVSQHVGHNPLGQLAVYVMWLLILFLAASGWLSRTDAFWGEDWPVDSHALLSDILLGFVALHLFAVIFMSVLQKQNLIKAMITGKRNSANIH